MRPLWKAAVCTWGLEGRSFKELELQIKESLPWHRHCLQGEQEGYRIAEDLSFSRLLDHEHAAGEAYRSRKGESPSSATTPWKYHGYPCTITK